MLLDKNQRETLKDIANGMMYFKENPVHDVNFLITVLADIIWDDNMLNTIKSNILEDSENYMISTLEVNLQYDIDNIKDIIESNLIEYSMEYKLDINNEGINAVKDSLMDEMNTLLKSMGYYIKVKDFYKKTSNAYQLTFKPEHVTHCLRFIENTQSIIHDFLDKKIYQPLKGNTIYQQQFESYLNERCDDVKEFSLEIDSPLSVTGIKGFIIEPNIFIEEQKKNNKWIPIEKGFYNKNKVVQTLLKTTITNEFKKHPTIAKKLYELTDFQIRCEGFTETMNTITDIHNHLHIIKSEKLNVLDVINPLKINEEISDILKDLEIDHNVKKLINGLFSNKNKHLMGFSNNENDYKSSDNYKYFKELVGLKVDGSELQKSIGSKLSRYKTSDELGTVLSEYISTLNGFDMDSVIKKSKNFNADIIEKNEDNNQLIIKVTDYESSKALGSQSWCISYSEMHFQSYTRNENRQYFIFNFDKAFDDNLAIIGITLDKQGKYSNAHDKHDNALSLDKIKPLIAKINEIDYNNNKKKTKSCLNK